MEWEPDPSSPYGNNGYSHNPTSSNTGLRRRNIPSSQSYYDATTTTSKSKYSNDKALKRNFQKLDLFPKVEQDLTFNSESSKFTSMIAYALTFIIILAEIYNHSCLKAAYHHHVTVDKSLGNMMRVDLNITFPALHCDDVHIDIMDVAGDAHNDVVETIKKVRLHLNDGSRLSDEEISISVNNAHKLELEALEALDRSLSPDYCGPCYGAQEREDQCCNHCEDVVNAYKAKNWDYSAAHQLAEQCIREGKTKPKPVIGGEGCNVNGYMEFKRVNGNFHIAMGEGIERNGNHIHTFLPEDLQNFNASHIIHTLRFGPLYDNKKTAKLSMNSIERTSLEGVSKIVTEENGVTGSFQYFIKIVPTTYKGKRIVKEIDPTHRFKDSKEPQLETNRYFVTEHFTPLMEPDDEHYELAEELDLNNEEDELAATKIGGNAGTSHTHHKSHRTQKTILPGVFFIYQVYPFVIEISKEEASLIHLFIRIIATIGGTFTIVGWLDAFIYSKKKHGTVRK